MQEAKKLCSLIGRNTKTYFKDKFLFFTSMLTPLILLVLFFTFLRNIYIDSFTQAFPEGFSVDSKIINGIAGAWLLSSVLSVSSVTVAFCANMVMVDDKIHSSINDFKVAPVKSTTISISYLISNIFVVTLVIISVLVLGCIYGFISGAYMPISSFSKGLANFLGLLPGTYGTSIMRNHCMNGYLNELANVGVASEAIKGIRDGFDANIYFFDNSVSLPAMYGIIVGTCAALLIIYILIVILKNKNVSFKFFDKIKNKFRKKLISEKD